MTAYRRRTGRALPCVNSDNTDYKLHRMRTIYVRASMVGGRARNSRSFQPIDYLCPTCQKYWAYDDWMNRLLYSNNKSNEEEQKEE
jgi:hypothetical protein